MDIPLSSTSFHKASKQAFINANPFPMVVVDNFLPEEVAEGLTTEIEKFDSYKKSNDYIFAKNKYEDSDFGVIGEYSIALHNLYLSSEFSTALSKLCGKDVFVDNDFVGGGLHRGGEASFLDMHVDFGLHPKNARWVRELNILLYLNKGWLPKYGGNLELRNGRSGQTHSVEPLYNRLVVMLTKDYTYHGYKPISFPQGTFRTSIAAYAYFEAQDRKETRRLLTTTKWKPKDAGITKKIVAKVAPSIVAFKQKILGSSTARKSNKAKF